MGERVSVSECECVCVCARRPTRPNLVGRGSEHTIPPQSLQEGTSLLPQLPQIKGSFVIWLHHPCPPLPALKIQSPFLAPTALLLTRCRCLSAVARRLICSPHCPKLHLSSCLPSASSTAYQNQFHGSGSSSGRLCPVLSCNPFLWGSIPVKVCLLRVLAILCLSLSSISSDRPPQPTACLTLPVCPSLPPFPNYQSLVSSLELPTSPRPHSALPLICSALLSHPPPQFPTSTELGRIVRANQRLEPREGSPISVDLPNSRIVAGVELRCKLGPSLRPLHIHPAPATLSPSRRNQQ